MPIETYAPPPQCVQIAHRGKVVGHMSVGGGMLLMPTGEKTVLLEMHNYLGPIPCGKRTEEPLEKIPCGFWDAFERWDLGGKKVDGNLCVVPAWCEPCKGTGDELKHLGGRHWEIVGNCPRCKGERIEFRKCQQQAEEIK